MGKFKRKVERNLSNTYLLFIHSYTNKTKHWQNFESELVEIINYLGQKYKIILNFINLNLMNILQKNK